MNSSEMIEKEEHNNMEHDLLEKIKEKAMEALLNWLEKMEHEEDHKWDKKDDCDEDKNKKEEDEDGDLGVKIIESNLFKLKTQRVLLDITEGGPNLSTLPYHTVPSRTVPYPTVFHEGPLRPTAQRTVLF